MEDLLQFPIAVIDFEASSLDQDSYPIECGIAVWEASGHAVAVWSSLIVPSSQWLRSGCWSRKSERVHGISKAALAAGLPPAQIALELNSRCGSMRPIFCDGGDYDRYWLKRLYDAAGSTPAFVLTDVDSLFGRYPQHRDEFLLSLNSSPQLHRAGPDAMRICTALARAFAT